MFLKFGVSCELRNKCILIKRADFKAHKQTENMRKFEVHRIMCNGSLQEVLYPKTTS